MTSYTRERGAVAGPRVRDRGCYGGSPNELSRRELLAAGASLAVLGVAVIPTRDPASSRRLLAKAYGEDRLQGEIICLYGGATGGKMEWVNTALIKQEPDFVERLRQAS